MKTLRQIISEANETKTALGHFNISNLEGFWGVVRAAQNLDLPVIIGLSEGERDFIGLRQARALVDSARTEFNQSIFFQPTTLLR
jgi:fructose-bisphosphate aldolase, class II